MKQTKQRSPSQPASAVRAVLSVATTLLALGLLFGLWTTPAHAQGPVIYVDADYVGTETGSASQPFDTIQEAHDASTDGVADVIYVKAGTTNPYSAFTVTKGGDGPESPDVYTVWPGTGSYPVISDTAKNLIRIDADYVTLDGLEVDGSGGGTGDLIYSGLSVAASYVTIRNCKVHDSATDEGIQLKNAPYAWIENVESYDNAGDGIDLCCGSYSSTVRFNYAHDNAGALAYGGFYFYEDGQPMDGLLVEHNVSAGNRETGINLRDVDGATIHDNLISGTLSNGSRGVGIFLNDSATANTVSNNTVYGSATDGVYIPDAVGLNNVIRDNIIVSSTNYAINAAVPTQTVDYNLYWNSGLSETYNVATGTHSLVADPLFVTGPAGPGPDFYLDPSSPAVDAGSQSAAAASLSLRTTRTNQQGDQGVVDVGYHYPAQPYTLTLAANPSAITANGVSTTTLTATVRTQTGDPVPDGTTVVFRSTLGYLGNWMQIYVTSTTSGVATAVLTSVPSSSTVTATVQADAYGTSAEGQILFTENTCQSDLTAWTEYAANPVFDPAQKVYYPTVIYDANAFGHSQGDVISASVPYTYVVTPYYKMWTARSSANRGLQFDYSDDGLTWYQFDSGAQLTGLASQGYHSRVLYDAGGFGGSGYYYKIWYWDPSVSIYGITAIRAAESVNGIQWVNDQVLTQEATKPLVTGTSPDWNRGSYGPVDVLYNPAASNSGSNPFDYSFAMYYDGTTGAFERVGLGYSADGLFWTRYGDGPVLDSGGVTWGASTPWDSTYVGTGTVLKEASGIYHFWFSGGTTALHHGIGYAVSSDGLHWSKSVDNPIFHVNDGVSWRDERTYTPVVLRSDTRFDGHGSPTQYKMWFTGDDGSNRAIGYATLAPVNLSAADTSGSGQSGAAGTALDQPFVVGLRDGCGDPTSGVTVTLAISGTPAGASGQSLSVLAGTTGASGQVSTTLTLGDEPGVYTVTAQAAGVSGMPAVFTATATPGPVHHFTLASIGGQVETRPFTITITAEDAFSNTVTSYTSPVTLTDSTGTISPTLSGSFASGVLAQPVVVNTGQTGVVITATHTTTPAITGVSDPFDVQSLRVKNLDTGQWFVTIQAAIDDPDTSNTHTISATAGTYTENITVTKGITLTGVSSATTTIDGNDVYNAVTIITDDVTLLNFTVQGGYQCGGEVADACGGIVVDSGDDATLLAGIHVANDTVVSNAGNGIFVRRADGALIEGNLIHDNGDGGNHAGISLIGGAWGAGNALVKNTVIRGNDIYSNTSYGVYMGYGVQDNVVEDNGIHDNAKYGVEIIRFQPAEPLRDNVIRGNYIFDNGRNGIKLPNAVGTQVLTNTIASNGWGSTKAKYQYGVMIEGFSDGSAASNLLSGNQFVNNRGGGLIVLQQNSRPVTDTVVQHNSFITSSVAISNGVPYSVTATFNDWGVTGLAAIEGKIYHRADDPALGEVLYYGLTLSDDGGSPMADGASYATITATLTGLLDPAGNVISLTTDLGTLGATAGTAGASGTFTTIVTSTADGTATITGTAGMTGPNPRSDATQVTFAPLTLDHFHVYPIQDQTAGAGFPVAISARDASDRTVTGFDGWASLADTTTTLTPTAPIQFHDGVWSGVVTVTRAYAGDVVTATYTHDASKNGASNAFDVEHGPATTVTLSPASATVTAGQSVTYTAWATDTLGNGWDATTEAAYAITPGAGGSWAGNTYTAQYSGTRTVTATVDGVDGTATLTVGRGPATHVTLTPDPGTITAGDSVTYTATAGDGHGNTWDVTTAAVYTITPGAGGWWTDDVYTSQVAGTWTVTATWSGLTGAATLQVGTAAVAEIGLSPATATLAAGQSVAYVVVATDTVGNGWDATAGSFFGVDSGARGTWAANVYTTEVAGDWTVTAVYGGQSDTASLAVTAGPPQSIEYVSGRGQSREVGTTLAPFVVAVKDGQGNPVSSVPVTCTITGAPAGATGQGMSTASANTLSNGQASSTLTLGDGPGVYTVTASSPGLGGSPVVFTATAVAPDLPPSGKSVDRTTARAGQVLTYTIVLANDRPVSATLLLYDPIPAQTTYVSGSAGGGAFTGPEIGPAARLAVARRSAERGSTELAEVSRRSLIGLRAKVSAGEVGAVLWNDVLPPYSAHTISFAVRIAAGAQGTITNTASVYENGQLATTLTASTGLAQYTLLLTSGQGQGDLVGATLAAPFVVTVQDEDEQGVSDVAVEFAITGAPEGATGQRLSVESATTAASGQASTVLILGSHPGVYTVTASSPGLGGSPVVFAATAVAPDVTGFRKSVDKSVAEVGQVLTYAIALANDSPVSTTLLLYDPIHPDTTCLTETIGGGAFPASGASAEQLAALDLPAPVAQGIVEAVIWQGILSPYSTHTITFAVHVEAGAQGTITNTASVYRNDQNIATLTASTEVKWHTLYLPVVMK